MQPIILIVEDDSRLNNLLAQIIQTEGYKVLQAASVKQCFNIVQAEEILVVISDVKLPGGDGLELIAKIKELKPYIEVISFTGYSSIKDSTKAIKNGAFDYLVKGDDNGIIVSTVHKAFEKALGQHDLSYNKNVSNKWDTILGISAEITKAKNLAQKVANSSAAVLLLGETGTGKEAFAQALHYESHRSQHAFVAVNCSSFSGQLLQSELFGHVSGAFTGAIKDKKGLFEEAGGGTLFLDEIGDMSFELQAQLLRVLETGTFHKVGDVKTTKVDVRIVAATHKDLKAETEKNLFRADLYYRLSMFIISLPPLRHRQEDIEILTSHFVQKFSSQFHKKINVVDSLFLSALKQHPWKGNIRELRNVIERVLILTNSSKLTIDLLPLDFFNDSILDKAVLDLSVNESQFIRKALDQTGGNKTEAARLLGIGLSTLYRKIHEYQILGY